MFGWIQSVPPIICDCCWPPRDDTSFNRQQLHILLYWSVTLNTSFRGFQKKIQVISSGTHVLYTDTTQPEYWCCVKILGDCFGCIQGLTKCHPPPLKPYSIECSLRLQLPSDSCSHLWQNRSGWSGCLDFAEYAQYYTWPKMSYNGAFSSKSTKKIPLFIFRVNVFSKATKALMYPHSSYSLLINFETFCLERNYLFSLRRYSHLHIHKSYSLMLLASLPSKFLI